MQKLFTNEQFESSKSRDTLPLKCCHCAKVFYRTKNQIRNYDNPKQNNTGECCSPACGRLYRSPPQLVKCTNCETTFKKLPNQIKRAKNHFCSRSCSTTYHNTHKTKGTRRSKLERWIQEQLTHKYPTLEIHYNKTDAINAELDIYIPALKLAFELNGVFHYEPIFGEEKLSAMKTNDKRKFQACAERKIALCVIDTSAQKYFKEKSSEKFLKIITDLIGVPSGIRTHNLHRERVMS